MPRRGSDSADFVVDPADLQSIVDGCPTASRNEILLSDLSAGSFAALESLERCVEQEFLHAAAHARMICDLHWENMREEQAASGEAAALHTRVRVINGSVQAVRMKASGPVKLGNKEERYISR